MGIIETSLIAIGLAMDAFSVSMANGIREQKMGVGKICGIAAIFGLFQGVMPMIGWLLLNTAKQLFSGFEAFIPWIALGVLGYLGGKMLYEGIKSQSCPVVPAKLTFGTLLLQGVGTSIDAMSAGLEIEAYPLPMALVAAGIIAVVTFGFCVVGVCIGKKAGSCLSGKAGIVGGAILILIGLEIFISGITGWF